MIKILGSINQGGAVGHVDMLGNKKSIAPAINNSGQIENTINNPRWDNNQEFNSVVDVTTSSSGVVTAIAGQRIEVVDYELVSSAGANVTFYSDDTNISGTMAVAANGNISKNSDFPVMKTNYGENLRIVTSAGNLRGHLTYKVG